MGLLELFEKLGDEHWSAKIKEERLIFFREQIAATDKKISVLEGKNAKLKLLVEQLEAEKFKIEKEKNICQARLGEIHKIVLNETQEKILIAVASYSGQHPATFAHYLRMSEQETTEKLNYLYSLGLLLSQPGFIKDKNSHRSFSHPTTMWIVSNKGHAYIKAHDLNSKIA